MSRYTTGLIVICLLTFFTGLGRPAITDSDEAFYAESAREMIERGDWVTPHFNDIYRFEKPVLYYWLVAVGYLATGVSETTARAPSAIAGLGLVLLTFACARRWFDVQTALLAGLITATSFGYITMARQALPDLPLAFFVTLTIWAAFRASLDDPSNLPTRTTVDDELTRRQWLLVASIAAAGGMLVKGPAGLVLPVIVVVPLVLWEFGFSRRRWHLSNTDLSVAALVFVALAIPWFLVMTQMHGTEYLARFFVGENIDRFATARYNDPRPIWYYLPVLVGGLLPWSLFMILWTPAIRFTNWRQARLPLAQVRLAVWTITPLLFYTISVGKQPRYILPILPPLAILLAVTIRRALNETTSSRSLLTACTTASGLLLIGVGGLIYRLHPLLVAWNSMWVTALAATVATAGIGVIISGAIRPTWVPHTLTAASIVVALGANVIILSSPGPAPVEQVAAMVHQASHTSDPYGRHRVFDRNLIFYTKRAFVELPILKAVEDFLRSPERVLCVLLDEDVKRLEARGITLVRLGDVSYFNTGNLTLRTLINPDPNTYLQRVVLVSNK